MDCFLSSVRVIVIFTESITNPRNIICYVETRTDFSGWIVNPSSCKSATVAIILLKQISKVSPSNKEPSIYFTDKCPPFDLRYLHGGVNIFVKTHSWWKSFGKDTILIVFFLPEQFQIFLVIIFLNRDAIIVCIFQVNRPKITTLSVITSSASLTDSSFQCLNFKNSLNAFRLSIIL